MNFMGTVLCCLPLVNAALMNYRTLQARELLPDRQAFEAESQITAPADAPDIYYLVLDGYGRADFLQEEFDFDNSDLVSFLEERGFVIAQKSRASAVRGKSRHRTVSLDRSMSYGLFCPGTI